MDFTHFDENGNAIMVDVSSKDTTQRSAIAYGEIYVGKEILEKIVNHQMKKGDVLSVARIAGIMAVKKTSEIIPLCHPLLLSKITVDFNINHEKNNKHSTYNNLDGSNLLVLINARRRIKHKKQINNKRSNRNNYTTQKGGKNRRNKE